MRLLDERLTELGIEPIRGSYGPASSAEVDELERKLQRSLPADYRHYLLKYGYATFDELVSAPLADQQEAPIAVFFGGGGSGEPILKEFEKFDDGAEAGVLPIARDPFGNLFLLKVGSSEVRYARFEDDGVTSVPLAASFEDFLLNLSVEAYDD